MRFQDRQVKSNFLKSLKHGTERVETFIKKTPVSSRDRKTEVLFTSVDRQLVLT